MMVYEPLERADGRFDYTCRSGSVQPHALGYCGGWRYDRWIDEERVRPSGPRYRQGLEKERAAALPFKDKYHDDGHATSEEAHACYRAFCLDQRLEFRNEPDTRKRCAICNQWTGGRALLNRHGSLGPEMVLCSEHQTREGAAAALAKQGKTS